MAKWEREAGSYGNSDLMLRAADRLAALEAENAAWLQVWDNVRLNVPTLREQNKPLAVAASYELQRLRIAELERERDAMRTLLKEARRGDLPDDVWPKIDAALAKWQGKA